jgi:hypothetical protein
MQRSPRSSSPSGVFSALPPFEDDNGDGEEESKEWREDTRLMFAADEEAREGAELLLPAHSQLGALVFVVTAAVVQVVASKAVLNSVQSTYLPVILSSRSLTLPSPSSSDPFHRRDLGRPAGFPSAVGNVR